MITTTSCSRAAAEMAARMSAGSSATRGRRRGRPPHSLTKAAMMRELNSVMAPGGAASPGSISSRAGRDDGDAGPRGDRNGDVTRGEERADVVRADAVAARQQQLGGDDVLADQSHVLPRCGGGAQRDALGSGRVDVLDHHHRVGPRRERMSGVDVGELAFVLATNAALPLPPRRRAGLRRESQLAGSRLAGAEGVHRAHRDAVHRRSVVVRHRDAREDGLRRHPAETLLDRHHLGRTRWRRQLVDEELQGVGERLLVQIARAGHVVRGRGRLRRESRRPRSRRRGPRHWPGCTPDRRRRSG